MSTIMRRGNGLFLCCILCAAVQSMTVFAGGSDKKSPPREQVFSRLSLATNGLEFPHSPEVLSICKKTKSASCLKTYRLAMDAKKTLKTNITQQSLLETLEVINRTCSSQRKSSDSLACTGALVSLFFYNTRQFDEIIFEKIKNMSQAERSSIFEHHYHWYGNRPNPKLWIDYIQSAPIEWATSEAKRVTLEYFSAPEAPPYWLAP